MYSDNQYKSRFAVTAEQKGFQHCTFHLFCLFVLRATAPPVGHGLVIHEVSRSYTTTHHIR